LDEKADASSFKYFFGLLAATDTTAEIARANFAS
jgi:hypothetical protein